jgi:hypothetical protein
MQPKTLALSRAALARTYQQHCVLHTPGVKNPDDPYGPPLGAEDISSACRATFQSTEYQTSDGTVSISECQLFLPYALTPPEIGTVTFGVEYRIAKRKPLTDDAGNVLEWRLLLGGRA